MTVLLETRGLGKSYGDKVALAGLDLRIETGEMVGLLGPNGAGKTTAISMIAGVLTPTRGSAAIAGHDVRGDRYAARRVLGLVPQDLALYEELSARHNLAFFGALWGLGGAELAKRIDWTLDLAGLTDRASEPVKRYSGGMKRRLNLAAGLLHRPQLVILDEPTVGVDPQSRNHIFTTIRRLREQEKMTVLYTSHYMEEVQALCERVAILDHGVLIADDAIDALVRAHGGGALQLEIDGDQAAVVAAIEGAGATVRAVRSGATGLESVFLHLTGKHLRDEE
jgi:linearmycin/streptolysin S transport system ATP-binding protein